MGLFRVIGKRCTWTVRDDKVNDATVFLSNHFYKSPTSNGNFLVVDNAIVNLDNIVAIEKLGE